MPRTLPWLLDTPASSTRAPSSRDFTPQPRRAGTTSSSAAAAAPPSSAKKNALNPITTPPGSGGSRAHRRDFLRSSPTPPSSPIHRCPSEEYLIPGLQNDDIYMMVEDEFYAVAQTFTQHLHYAEYVRRKKEVKALQRQQQQEQLLRQAGNGSAIGDLVRRPTDGVTPVSEESKKKEAREVLSARQKEGLETMVAGGGRVVVSSDGEDDEVDDAWVGTSLHELMVSPRKNRSLVGMQGIRSSTRAAAGLVAQAREGFRGDGAGAGAGVGVRFEQVENVVNVEDNDEETASEDDDDLDVHVHVKQTDRRQPPPTHHATSSKARKTPPYKGTINPDTKKAQSINATTTTSTYRTPTPKAMKSKRRLFFDDWDELPEPPPQPNIQVQSRQSSSSSETPPPRTIDPQAKKKTRLNEVPTFLL
ncbi:uncharacterized protein BP01DRAFT_416957 [Aspergillus saccharolyticus JOP 1030-1]|uniref:Uncharacterized protein n=1 Tax=Aspergillus saccharolyticus JOP 1030-1 TaxID=1450539 RepID=A0A318ZJL3_9EURO|nr:hypothetical protein BP01DRAFT_416957 [Aspergillus saccharolyticus JOP 1030-1]PYH43950.1 hypothetical protein BP01DRAFT_416957 [Aspergillus saccharolyticus JOP 1030-1]